MFTAGGHFYNPDEILSYATTQAIVEKGSLNIAFAQPLIQSFGGTLNGHIYSQHGLLEPFLALPLFVLGTLLHLEQWRVVTLLYSPTITSASVCLVYLISRRLGRTATLSVLLSVLYGTATLAWPYSKTFFELPTASLMLLIAVYFLLGSNQPNQSTVLSGFFSTVTVFAAITQILALPCLLAYVVLKPHVNLRQRLVTTALPDSSSDRRISVRIS